MYRQCFCWLSLTVVVVVASAPVVAEAGELGGAASSPNPQYFSLSEQTNLSSIVPARETETSLAEGTGVGMSPPMAIEPSVAFNCCPDENAEGLIPGCKVRLAPYGWLPETYGQATIRGDTAEVAVSSRDMLNLLEHNTHFIFAGLAEIESGPWTVIATGLYVNAGFDNAIRRFQFDSGFGFAIVDSAVAYRIEGLSQLMGLPEQSGIEVLAGTRYWMLDGDVVATGPFGNSAPLGRNYDWVDPVIGGRITLPLWAGSRLRVRGDYGGFGWGTASQKTWNIEAMFEQRLSPNCTLMLGYRVLDVENSRGSGSDRIGFDVQMRGPIATFAIEF